MTESQIGAQKKQSVRNHMFVLNSIISDVLSSKKKAPIDLNVMDYKQMFDSEEVPICLNALYSAGVKDDIFALICETNTSATVAIKTPGGLTEEANINNRIMQGDVLSPLVSSNMVDQHIGRKAFETGNIYIYKNKVKIPPLAMVDDTLGISECGVKTTVMNQFLNTRTNLMSLQFGHEKCVKMHIGKQHNKNVCSDVTVDAWEEVKEDDNGRIFIKDKFAGKKVMEVVDDKTYLGDLVSKDGKNVKNIKNRTDKSNGNINKIISTLQERPLGKHTFKAFTLLREGLLLGGLLSNSESWINITKKDIDQLEKPDTILQRKALSAMGNPSKVFIMLELGIIPIRYILMKKRMLFLHYILKENKESMIHKVFKALNEDSRKGDFIDLTNKDKLDLNIDLTNIEIESISKWSWKKCCLYLPSRRKLAERKDQGNNIH